MNLLKKLRGNGNGHGKENTGGALAKRGEHGELGHPLSRFRDAMGRMFERAWRDFDRDPWSLGFGGGASDLFGKFGDWPAMDVAEDEKSLTVRLDVPGLDPKDLDVEVSGNLLTVRGSRQDEWKDHKGGLYRHERHAGSFTRTVTLPGYVEADKVDARYDKGTLTLVVPKQPGKGAKRVSVTT